MHKENGKIHDCFWFDKILFDFGEMNNKRTCIAANEHFALYSYVNMRMVSSSLKPKVEKRVGSKYTVLKERYETDFVRCAFNKAVELSSICPPARKIFWEMAESCHFKYPLIPDLHHYFCLVTDAKSGLVANLNVAANFKENLISKGEFIKPINEGLIKALF